MTAKEHSGSAGNRYADPTRRSRGIEQNVAGREVPSKTQMVRGARPGGTTDAESFGCHEPSDTVETANDLHGSEDNLRRVIDTIPAMAWCARPDGSMEFLNRQWHDYTGLSPAETM